MRLVLVVYIYVYLRSAFVSTTDGVLAQLGTFCWFYLFFFCLYIYIILIRLKVRVWKRLAKHDPPFVGAVQYVVKIFTRTKIVWLCVAVVLLLLLLLLLLSIRRTARIPFAEQNRFTLRCDRLRDTFFKYTHTYMYTIRVYRYSQLNALRTFKYAYYNL